MAKDDNANVTTRAAAAKDAIVDKKDEKIHDTKADLHKGKSTSVAQLYDGILTIPQSRLSTRELNLMEIV